jgi:hypothetical protein
VVQQGGGKYRGYDAKEEQGGEGQLRNRVLQYVQPGDTDKNPEQCGQRERPENDPQPEMRSPLLRRASGYTQRDEGDLECNEDRDHAVGR